jgi:3-(3-hydroxy-phenyl)propionate hydroxylase
MDMVSLRSLSQLHGEARIVQVVAQAKPGAARETIVDTQARLSQACGLAGTGWALIRPDSYLAAKGQQFKLPPLKAALASLAGTSA